MYKKKADIQQQWPLWRIAMAGLSLLALLLSILLLWHYFKGGLVAGCSGRSSCEEVLNSQWSMIAGMIPVSGLAMGVYLAILVAISFIGSAIEIGVRRLAWQVLLILVGAVAGSALWFIYIQVQIIGKFCPYCMAAHITGLLLAALTIRSAWKEYTNFSEKSVTTKPEMKGMILPSTTAYILRPLHSWGLVTAGMALAGILAIFQVVFIPSSVHGKGTIQERNLTIDYHSIPMAGSPDAPYIVTLLYDYQCAHCQQLHFILNEVVEKYQGKLAFALCPTPLNTQCNPYVPQNVDAFKHSCELARIGLAIWISNRDAFQVFENWMFSFESGGQWHPRELENAKAKAIELIGRENFDAALSDIWIDQYIQTCAGIYGQTIQNGKGGVPKLIFGNQWMIPEVFDAETLILMLQKYLDIAKPRNNL